ncbi:MAG TPA: 5-deoxy-glucuronate isomerase [Vicinamibacteria bacterium]|nr:5-deoxy-glucuronate isomerase [Vicinamibacteria bacterium]
MRSPALIDSFRGGFGEGHTPLTREGEAVLDTGVDFGIVRAREGSLLDETHGKETAWLLLDGEAEMAWDGGQARVARGSLFDEPPTALHVPARTNVRIRTLGAWSEWAVARATNEETFAPRLFEPAQVPPEYRGRGLVQNASLRNVRLVFDDTNRKQANLVLGEVVNVPGRWSSYPPHHHAQPEVYHYRFTLPQGYGHAELGEDVYKVRGFDTLKITDGLSHAQVSAPGYGMYYIWIVRHLPGNRYTGFHFTPEHAWVLDPSKQGWRPEGVPGL